MQENKVESRHTVRDNTIPWIRKLLEIDRTRLDVFAYPILAFYFKRFEAAAAIALWKP